MNAKLKVDCFIGGQHAVSYIQKNYHYYLHMNWGWSTYSEDTWYYGHNTHPVGSANDYKWNKHIIMNIHP